MIEQSSQKRFKTAGARILRSRKLPKDFFNSSDRNLRYSESTHSEKNPCLSQNPHDNQKKYPDIFQFTFMAKQNKQSHSLRKTKSNVFLPWKEQFLPPLLRRTLIQKENVAPSASMVKEKVARQGGQPEDLPSQYKRKLHKISLTQLNRG